MNGKGWWLLMLTIVLAFVAAGQVVSFTTKETTATVTENRDALVTVCGTLGTLSFVFDQLRILDEDIALNPTLSPSVRADVASRAQLYGTAVDAIADTDANCEQIG